MEEFSNLLDEDKLSEISRFSDFVLNFQIYSFDKAMRKTRNKKKDNDYGCCKKVSLAFCCGVPFHVLFFLANFLMAFLWMYI